MNDQPISVASDFITDFRHSAPYIHYLRGKTIVITISSRVLLAQKMASLAADIQLLSSLGVRLVLLYGTRQYLNDMLAAQGESAQYHHEWRITDETTLRLAKQACGLAGIDMEAALSAIPTQTPDRSAQSLKIARGNFIRAKPLGVIHGVDFEYTGRVRKIDSTTIQKRLDENQVVLIGPLGHSLSGQSYNLGIDDLSQALAISLKAEKLIFLTPEPGILDKNQQVISQITASELQQLIDQHPQQPENQRILKAAVYALDNGVSRVHILSGLISGSIIQELFTREGSGTMLAQSDLMRIRSASNHDIGDIMKLISPLEESGILLPRNREYLETHISEFSVLEHDRHVYGCIALRIYEDQIAELACLVVSPDAQNSGYGSLLLRHSIDQAKQKGAETLLALSTQTSEWFHERGFQPAQIHELPEERQMQYADNHRHSKIFKLILKP